MLAPYASPVHISICLSVAAEYLYTSMLKRVHKSNEIKLTACVAEVQQLLDAFPTNLGTLTAQYLQMHPQEVLIPHTRAVLQFMRAVVDRYPLTLTLTSPNPH